MSTRRPKLPTGPRQAIIYLRVSTDEQARSGLGREAQEAAARAYCARQGWPVAGVHVDDGLSGKLPVSERPGLRAAIEATHAAPGTAFVVYALTRAFRTQRECWSTIEDSHGEPALPLVSASEPFDLTTSFGRASFGMLVTFARLEADLASDRTVAALGAARARGVKLGAPSMVERVTEAVDDAGKVTLTREVDPGRMAIVREIRAAHEGGASLRAIVADLNARCVPTAKPGARWHVRTVRVALGLAAAESAPALGV